MHVSDGFENLVASLGNQKDKAAYAGWRTTLKTPEQYEEIYRGSAFGRKIVDIPVDDMTRRWRGWNAPEAYTEAMEAAEKRFKVRERFSHAARWGRLYGSAAAILGLAPRLGLPSEPLRLDQIRRGDLKYIHVDIYPRLQIDAWETDIESERFGQPRTYLYQPQVRGGYGEQQVRIHASRVLPFSGQPLPPLAAQRFTHWGDSSLAAVEDQLNTAGSALAVIASLIYEAKVDVISTDLSGLSSPDGEARLLKRFSLANTLKSINNTLLMQAGDKYDQKTFNFAGLPEIHIRLLQELSGAADIPATRFLSQAPAGLQATGEADYRNYADMISGKQETDLRPHLEYLDTILAANAGLAPEPGAFWFFHPLWQESAKEKAENFYKFAQGTKLIDDTGAIPEEALRKGIVSRLVEDGVYPALDEAMKAFENAAGDLKDIPEAEPGEDDDTGTVIPFRRVVAQDAEPRSLYVSRKVTNAAEIAAWARAQGIPNLVPADKLHVTVAYSRAPVDWFAVGTDADKALVPRGGPRMVERFDGGAIVLCFSDWSLRWRHESLRDAGCSWDHDGYQPHITVGRADGDFDLSKVEPYQGKIALGEERFEEIDEDWQAGSAAAE